MKSFALIISILIFSVNEKSDLRVADPICLTKEEALLYDMIMEYRKENNLPPIPLSAKLTRVAKTHAVDLTLNYEFDPSNKCNPHSWSKKGNWTSCCYTSDHKQASCMWSKPKEIAGYNSSGYEIAYYSTAGASAKEGLDGWKVSPGHNPLLINSDIWSKVTWKGIGIALYKEYGLVWFGEAQDDSLLERCD